MHFGAGVQTAEAPRGRPKPIFPKRLGFHWLSLASLGFAARPGLAFGRTNVGFCWLPGWLCLAFASPAPARTRRRLLAKDRECPHFRTSRRPGEARRLPSVAHGHHRRAFRIEIHIFKQPRSTRRCARRSPGPMRAMDRIEVQIENIVKTATRASVDRTAEPRSRFAAAPRRRGRAGVRRRRCRRAFDYLPRRRALDFNRSCPILGGQH